MLIGQGAIDASIDPWRLNAERLLATQVPSTLTGVIQARLDGLPAGERLTLQEASVIGPVFWDRALVALDVEAEAMLPNLVRRELAVPRPDSKLDGLREYAFKHAILHQVTYGTLLKRQRKALHAKLADWLAAQSQSDSSRAGDFLGLTAQHYSEAGDDENAAEFHARAAEYAASRLAHGTVLTHAAEALAMLDCTEDSPGQALRRWRVLNARAQTLDFQGEREQQMADLDAMDRIAEMMGDDARRADTAYRRAYRAMRMAQHVECQQSALRSVSLAEAALTTRARSLVPADDGDGLHELRLLSRRLVGIVLINQGRWDDAQALLQQTLDEARAIGLLRPQAHCLASLGMLADRRGDPMRNFELLRESLDLWRRAGDLRNEAGGLGNLGIGWLGLGNVTAARRDLEEALRLVRQNGDRGPECAFLCNLSALALWRGDDASSLSLAHSALDTAVAVQARDWEAIAWLCMGDAEAALGRLTPAAQDYAQALRIATEIGHGVQFDASSGLARLALSKGDISGALQALRPMMPPSGASTKPNAVERRDPAAEPFACESTAGSLDAAMAPTMIEFTLHLVLAATGDPLADPWIGCPGICNYGGFETCQSKNPAGIGCRGGYQPHFLGDWI